MTDPAKHLGPTGLKRLHRHWRRRTTGRLALILDGVQNPYNLGSLSRLAAAYGVERVWSTPTMPLSSPKVQKTAMRSDRLVPWTEVAVVTDAFDQARSAGFRLVGIELTEGSVPLFDLDLGGDVALVLGHEERGLSATAVRGCDAVGYAPLVGRIGSLNVATAAATALYEVRRQEWWEAPPDPGLG